jgi:colanic acid/amylovoran biosynthesis glycosyltransferase
MKVAFIVGQFPALSETCILSQVTGLRERGYEVDMFACDPSKDPLMHGDVSKYNLLEHTYYLPSRSAGWRLSACCESRKGKLTDVSITEHGGPACHA